jgi:hypothetical protein
MPSIAGQCKPERGWIRNLAWRRELFFSPTEESHGTQIFEESNRGRSARNEKAQNRYIEERPLRSNGQEPQAGDRDRPVGGEGQGQEGTEESFEVARGFEKDSEEIQESEEVEAVAP